ncbi:MAG: hypothetical protein BWY09_00577 [Candidatus Hydrogenedentes bacterium ADurb.Bin179]|nr:MAG: hypothetical protein BWY09_00577 [Candidatus Hydrogenedentes bacterium ADurb.Bin179]
MSRVARVVVPGNSHHITQWGNRQSAIFETDADREAYLRFVGKYAALHGLSLWAYFLMTNHIHFRLPEFALSTMCMALPNKQ